MRSGRSDVPSGIRGKENIIFCNFEQLYYFHRYVPRHLLVLWYTEQYATFVVPSGSCREMACTRRSWPLKFLWTVGHLQLWWLHIKNWPGHVLAFLIIMKSHFWHNLSCSRWRDRKRQLHWNPYIAVSEWQEPHKLRSALWLRSRSRNITSIGAPSESFNNQKLPHVNQESERSSSG